MPNFLGSVFHGAAQLRIASKIAVAYVVVLCCAFALGAVAINRLEGVDAAAQEMRSHWLPQTRALGDLLFLAQRLRVIEAALLMAPPEGKAAEAKTIETIHGQIDQKLIAQTSIARDDAENNAANEIGALWRAYAYLDAKFSAAATANDNATASSLYRNEMRDAIHKLQDRLGRAVADNVAGGDEAAARGQRIGADAFLKIAAMFAVACFCCLASGIALWRGVAKPISALTRSMTALARGDRETTIPALDLRNELGEMARATEIFHNDSVTRREKLEIEARDQRSAADSERERASAERAKTHAELSQAMGALVVALRRLASGDLDQRLNEAFAGQYAGVRDDFNEATAKLKVAMAAVVDCAESIQTTSQDIATASNDLSLRTEQQAASLEQTAAALGQITTAVQKSAESVARAREVVAATDSDSKRSADTVGRAVSAMEEISKSSDHIGKIIVVIDEIAFQTNLLALNAGVEAARAGDAGKGFAVVAAEVRGLALRSAEAAKEIKSLVSASGDQVRNGATLVNETGAALLRVGAEISRINEIVNQIALVARDQASSLDEVNIAIREMDRTTQQNAAMVEQSAAATQTLTRDAAHLAELVSQFGIGRAPAESRLRQELKAQLRTPSALPRGPQRPNPDLLRAPSQQAGKARVGRTFEFGRRSDFTIARRGPP